MEERRGAYRYWWGSLRERDYLEDQDADGRINYNRYSGSG